MTSTTAAAMQYVDDDFLLHQRRELSARRASYREQVERHGASRTGCRPIATARLEAVPEATQCVSGASGSVLRRGSPPNEH